MPRVLLPEAKLEAFVDSLNGSPPRSGEGRSQGRVTLDERGEGAPQSGNVERGANSHRPRYVVSRTLRREVVQEPQAPLAVGEWVLGFSFAPGGRRSLCSGAFAQLRQNLRGELGDA